MATKTQPPYLEHSEAYGQPTFYIKGTKGASIIDFILTTAGQLPLTNFTVHDEESFSSDHLLVTTTVLLLTPPNHIRQHWKLQRLNEPEIYKLYVDTFTQQSQPTLTTINNIKTLQSYKQIEDIGKTINDAIYFSLDHSVTKSTLRPKHWKWFWNQELEDLAEKKKHKHVQWRKSLYFNNNLRTATLWKQYDTLNQQFKATLARHRAL